MMYRERAPRARMRAAKQPKELAGSSGGALDPATVLRDSSEAAVLGSRDLGTSRVSAVRDSIRRAQRGFTLIELMVVMAIISVLLAIAVPIYQKSIIRAKESVLRNNLFTIRNMIDEYTVDKQKAPETLQDLVTDGYLRQVPQDPMTGSDQTWKIIMEDAPVGGSTNPPGIFDVRSGSEKIALDGTQYSDW